MNMSSEIEWDWFLFTSYISLGINIQTINIDKANKIIKLEDGYFDSNRIEKALTKELLYEIEKCFEKINVYEWPAASHIPCADGELWSFEFYKGNQRVLARIGSNAYPKGYGKWIDFYSRLFRVNGIMEIHTCYRKEREVNIM